MSPTPRPDELSAQLRGILEPVVARHDLYLEDIQIKGGKSRPLVRVTIDLADGPGGVDADRLAEASRDISSGLDSAEDLLEGSYLLEVSTPGLNRPLRTARHFRRAIGHMVTIETTDARVSGRIVEADETNVVLQQESGRTSVPMTTVEKGRIDVEFKPANSSHQ